MRLAIRFVVATLAVSFYAALPAQAIPELDLGQTVTVQATGVFGEVVNISSPGFYTGGAWAGIYNLKVDGQATISFCIDPWQFDPSSPSLYTVTALANAPDNNPPGAMGANNALELKKLWSYYIHPGMTAKQASDFQLATWLLVGGPNFSITDPSPVGFSSWNAWLTAYEAPAAGATAANLVALSSPSQQDYLVSVPDSGTTLGLLGMAFTALAMVRRKLA